MKDNKNYEAWLKQAIENAEIENAQEEARIQRAIDEAQEEWDY